MELSLKCKFRKLISAFHYYDIKYFYSSYIQCKSLEKSNIFSWSSYSILLDNSSKLKMEIFISIWENPGLKLIKNLGNE